MYVKFGMCIVIYGWQCMWRHKDVQQADRRNLTYVRAPNAKDISQGSLTRPFKHRHRANLFIRLFRKPPHLVAFYDML